MQTVKEFDGSTAKLSLREFWRTAGPTVATIILLALVMILWERLIPIASRVQAKRRFRKLATYYYRKATTGAILMLRKLGFRVEGKSPWSRGEKVSDLETPNSEQAPTRPSSQEQALAGLPPSHPGEGTERSTI